MENNEPLLCSSQEQEADPHRNSLKYESQYVGKCEENSNLDRLTFTTFFVITYDECTTSIIVSLII